MIHGPPYDSWNVYSKLGVLLRLSFIIIGVKCLLLWLWVSPIHWPGSSMTIVYHLRWNECLSLSYLIFLITSVSSWRTFGINFLFQFKTGYLPWSHTQTTEWVPTQVTSLQGRSRILTSSDRVRLPLPFLSTSSKTRTYFTVMGKGKHRFGPSVVQPPCYHQGGSRWKSSKLLEKRKL